MHVGSAAWNLSMLEKPGDRFYIETTAERWAHDMRQASMPRTRRPAELNGREFTANLFTAIGSKVGDPVRYLICVERTL